MDKATSRFTRPVSANEHLYLAHKKYFSDLVIQLTVEGLGAISKEALQNALLHVSQVMPGIKLRLSGKQWIADSKPPPVIEQASHTDIWSDVTTTPHEVTAFDPKAGYTCDVLLAQGKLRSQIIFRALHAVMDGQGLMLWAKSVFQALRGEGVAPAASIMNEDLWLASQKAPSVKAPSKTPQYTGPISQGSPAETTQFHAANCTLKITHPAIVAKLSLGVQAILMNHTDSSGSVMVPVDLRPDLPDVHQRSTANLTLPLFLRLKNDVDWQTHANTLLDELHAQNHVVYREHYRWHRRIPRAILGWSVKKLWDLQTREGKYFSSTVISHIGRLPLDEFSTETFQATSVIAIPCAAPIAPFCLAVTENCIADDEIHTHICLITSKALFPTPAKLLRDLVEKSGFSFPEPTAPPKAAQQVNFADAPTGLHQLFEKQVAQSPNQRCLMLNDIALDYATVNRRANQLANYLKHEGLAHGEFVGAGLQRSFELIISILAIMKAGGVYLPLDPDLPLDRLQYFLKDSAVQWVMTTTTHADIFSAARRCILLDAIHEKLSDQPPQNLNVPMAPDDACYLLYTSGSSGFPKGTLNTHAGVVNHFCWLQETCQFGPNDATLQKTPISFDASLLEILLPLQSGASVVITPPGRQNDALHLLELIRQHQATFLSIVPSILERFLDEMDAAPAPSLRVFLVGGETFSKVLYDRIRQRFPASTIYNLYGPAEAAIDSVTFDCREEFTGNSVPIGKPIANMQAWVVDHQLNPVAPGETGELLIAGKGVGAGYWQRPALNAARFIPHPGAPQSGVKAYRTGDLAKVLPCGNLQFVGRHDQQVKIRGVRIEPGEIEHHLNQISWVKQAAVIAQKSHGQDVLIAYISTAKTVTEEQKTSLRVALENKLPQYMIPAVFQYLENLPLNSSGKIDRRALQQLNPENIADSTQTWSEAEQQLAAMWQVILGKTITPNCNFFLMGGNSMLVVKLLRQVELAFGLTLKPHVLFEHATFEAFSKEVLVTS